MADSGTTSPHTCRHWPQHRRRLARLHSLKHDIDAVWLPLQQHRPRRKVGSHAGSGRRRGRSRRAGLHVVCRRRQPALRPHRQLLHSWQLAWRHHILHLAQRRHSLQPAAGQQRECGGGGSGGRLGRHTHAAEQPCRRPGEQGGAGHVWFAKHGAGAGATPTLRIGNLLHPFMG